jgi:HTH-type transcriptional regulator / antitoxin HigA
MATATQPDYVVAPGEILAEHLEVRGFSQKEFATRVQLSEKHLSQIITGKKSITVESAVKFERVLGVAAKFWMDLESQYKLDLLRIEGQAEAHEAGEWARRFPLQEMISMGWLPSGSSWEEKADALLRFFSVSSPKAWEKQFVGICGQCRRTATKTPEIEPLSAWVQRLENQARQASLPEYSSEKLESHLPAIKKCLASPNGRYQTQLVQILADCGVYLAFEEHLPKTFINGVTMWVVGRPAIQMSLRYKFADILTFSFFHELAHVLLHKEKAHRFVDVDAYSDDPLEAEANDWAANQLIQPEPWKTFLANAPWMPHAVARFAKEVGVHPGTVVGRLAFESHINWNNHLASLRVRIPGK